MPRNKSQEKVIFKKYGNRRLYSLKDKSYVTLQDIESCIRKGCSVQVLDADSKTDLTSEVLTQILLEKNKVKHVPTELLEQLIRFNESQARDFWTLYVEKSFQMYSLWQKELQQLSQFFGPWNKSSKKD